MPVVVLDVLGKDDFEVTTAEEEEPVEALPTDRADEPFGEGVRPWCPDRRLDGPDSFGREDGVEGRREFGVAVADQELGRRRPFGEVEAEIAGLLGHPACDGFGRDSGEPDEAGVQIMKNTT